MINAAPVVVCFSVSAVWRSVRRLWNPVAGPFWRVPCYDPAHWLEPM
jgi:hypothetical protein